jgi:cytolysin-activating lysine-acyltransferase
MTWMMPLEAFVLRMAPFLRSPGPVRNYQRYRSMTAAPARTPDPFNHPLPEGHAKTTAAVLGEIVWLMSQSSLHKQFFISDLEWFVMTPVLLQQFRLFYAKDRPLGVVLWAKVDAETEARLQAGTTKLRPQDWKSSDRLWVVEVIAPFGGAEEMVRDLKAKVFPTQELRYVAIGADGKKDLRVV